MDAEFDDLNEQEAIKSENTFLKMKMMLEKGAYFGSIDDPGFSLEMENQFLKNIMGFENQFEEQIKIKVYDKIERPTIFNAVAQIGDEQIEQELKGLTGWLSEYNISVCVFSPNITCRELYRFITEDLFEYEMDDMDLSGSTAMFIYDEFYPDPIYENETAAVNDCIKMIFQKEAVEWLPQFRLENIRLNEYYPIAELEFITYINNFKAAYDAIKCEEVSEIKCVVNEKTSVVTGNYFVRLVCSGEEWIQKGKWVVCFETDDNYYWYINAVRLEGINF